jgi:ligand-binding sensor domain-containing protein
MSRFDNKTIYHGLQHLYKTTDAGETWKMISPDLSYNSESAKGVYPYLIYHQAITAIAEGDQPGFVVVGTDDGRVWLTVNDGGSWKEITNNLPKNKHVAKLFTSTTRNPPNLYLALNDRREDNQTTYLYKLGGDGATWQLISSNLPPSPANVIIEDPDVANVLYCGTDMGVYISKDGGKKWEVINGDLPASVSVNDMFIHPRDKKLVIGTYGRGVYVIDDLSKLR